MNAAVLREVAASSNTANALTPNYRRAMVSQSEQPGGGVVGKVTRATSSGEDLLGDAVARVGALYAFKANILSIRTSDQMIGTILDVRA